MAGGLKDFIAGLLEPLSGTTIRSMFGGHGVFRDGVMFGILDDDVLFFRVDAATQPKYEAERSMQFTYPGKGRMMAMPYWQVPERLFDDADEFLKWAKASFAAAVEAKQGRQPKGKKVAAGTRPAARTKPKASKKKSAPKRR